MLKKFHARDDIESAGVRRGVFLGDRFFVAHRKLAFVQMKLGDAKRPLGSIDTGDFGAAARERFREDAAAAADVEHPCAGEGHVLRDPLQAQRIDVVQRPKFALRIPPAVRKLVELLDFGRIDVHRKIGVRARFH
jgi:hypothetical protein